MDDEIDTGPFFFKAEADGKSVFVPRIEGERLSFYRYIRPGGPRTALRQGGFGIREPEPETPLAPGDFPALVLTPGLAFDRWGCRLGRGRGFYDRFFAGLDAGCLGGPPGRAHSYTAVGLCIGAQMVPEVPAEDHDKTMDLVLAGNSLFWKKPL
jgi:5-formyltetrahydrofolate cyclo-ligase